LVKKWIWIIEILKDWLYKIEINAKFCIFEKKRLFMRILGFLCFLGVFFQNTLCAQTDKSKYALLWEITGKGLPKPAYVFGSMHLPDARVFELIDSVLITLDACEAFAAEIDLDSAMTDGETISRGRHRLFDAEYELDLDLHDAPASEVGEKKEEELFPPLPEERPKTTKKGKKKKPKKSKKEAIPEEKKKIYEEVFRTKITDKHTFLDSYLGYQAKKHGKLMFGLEELEKHINLYGGSLSRDKHPEFEKLSDAEIFEKMITYYQTGDLELIKKFSGDVDNDTIMVLRNKIMVESIIRLSQKNSLFSVMGCAHLVGEKGVINMFRQRGYTVRAIMPQFSYKNIEDYVFKSPTKNITWHKNDYPAHGFSIETPYKANHTDFGFSMRLGLIQSFAHDKDYTHCQDVLTGCLYSFTTTPKKIEISQAKLLDSLKNQKFIKPDKYKQFRQGDQEILEIIMQAPFDSLQVFRMRLVDVQGKRYSLAVTAKWQHIYEDYTERFFNSLQLYQSDQRLKKWENKTGAFAIDMYGLPVERIVTVRSGEYGKQITQNHHIFRSWDDSSEVKNVVIYSDLIKNEAEKSDSIMFSLVEQYITKRLDSVYTQKESVFEGYPAKDFWIKEGKKNVRIKSCLRGNRQYIIANIQPESRQDTNWVHTFRFLPFESYELKKETYKVGDIAINVPKNNMHSSWDFKRSASIFDKQQIMEGADENTSVTFTVDVRKYGKYTYFVNQDSLTKLIKSDYVGKQDTILPTQEPYLLFKGKYANSYKILRTDYKPNGVYTLFMTLPKELLDKKHITPFLASLEYLPTKDTMKYDIFASKSSLLLEDLFSTDSILSQKARSRFYDYEFRQEDKPLLYKALEKDYYYHKSQKDYYPDNSIWKRIGELLKDTLTTADIDFIKTKYHSNDSTVYYKQDMLRFLLNQKKQTTLDIFLDLVANGPEKHIALEVHQNTDSLLLALVAQNYDKIVAQSDKKAMQDFAVIMGFHFVEGGDSLQRALVKKHLPALIQAIQKTEKEQDTLYLRGLREHFVRLARNLPEENAWNNILERMVQNHFIYPYHRKDALQVLLDKNALLQPATLDTIFKSDDLAIITLAKLQEQNKLHLVPKAYQKQTKVAEILAKNKVFEYRYDQDSLQSMKLLQTVSIKIEGKPTKFYIYRIQAKRYGQTNDYIVYVGGFRKGRQGFYPAIDKTGYVGKVEEKSEKEYNKQWLKEFFEEENDYKEFSLRE
jgi:uncharacterized protein YbaP (TraB family)